jgi:ABC-type glutathione transport system ATPase component
VSAAYFSSGQAGHGAEADPLDDNRSDTETDDGATNAGGGVYLRGSVKSYAGSQRSIRAVRGIDVSIAAGETAALLGPNGAGKSTTIDIFARALLT